MKTKSFTSKAANVAAKRKEDLEAAKFGNVQKAGEPPRDAVGSGRQHRVAFVCEDDLYYRLFRAVKTPDSEYANASELIRDAVECKLRELGE